MVECQAGGRSYLASDAVHGKSLLLRCECLVYRNRKAWIPAQKVQSRERTDGRRTG